VAIRTVVVNCHLSEPYPHQVTTRFVTLPILAVIFYLTAVALSPTEELGKHLRSLTLWVGSSLLAGLVWLDLAPACAALAWLVLAVALSLVSRRIRFKDLCYQGGAAHGKCRKRMRLPG
jgi:hypothetical protein